MALEAADPFLRKTIAVMAACGVAVMLVTLALICINIGLRPFGHGIRGVVEASGYMCALAVGLCMPGAQLAGSHISVGLRTDRLPESVRFAQAAACGLAGFALFALAGAELLEIAAYARSMGEYMEGFNVPYYGMTAGLAVGLLAHALVFAHGVASLICGGRRAAS